MSVGVMKDHKLKQRNLRASHTQTEIFFFSFHCLWTLIVTVKQGQCCRIENVTAGQQTGRGSDETGACFVDKAAP